jgi:fused signal recognition particle receptor
VGLFERLHAGLSRTAERIVGRIDELAREAEAPGRSGGAAVDVDTIEALEEVLLSADVGVAATERIVTAVRSRVAGGAALRDLVREELRAVFAGLDVPAASGAGPRVILIVGVNGTGKTTTVGKLARLMKADGGTPLVCAADTFRAAAVEQLEVWAERAGVEIVRAADGRDPASVVFDAVTAGVERGRDPILVDTAGRLHTRVNLMHELEKIRRVAGRAHPGAPHEVWLVLDATVGQNGVAQAREFMAAAGVTGVVLTKLDGTARGGIAVAIAHDLRLPIRYVGVGEGPDDLLPFSPDDYVDALFQKPW